MADLGKYPEYQYPFSYEGALEQKLDAFAASQQPCDVSDVLRLIGPAGKFPDCGVQMNPTFFREYYPRPGSRQFFDHHWAGEIAAKACGYPSPKAPGINIGDNIVCRYGEPLLRGGEPTWNEPQEYHCPYGWRRFSFEVPNFSAYETFAVAYHGTDITNVPEILRSCLLPGACQEGGDGDCTYLSPSIEYAACPRYAKPLFTHDRHVQVALQFRVKTPTYMQAETLGPEFHRLCPGGWASRPWGVQAGGGGRPYPKEHIVFDPHFKNEELEWLYSAQHFDLREALVPTGLMIRLLKRSPSDLLLQRQKGR